ncbi:MAG: hypothetical protein ACI36X_04055 [Bacteroidaceae bacterium]
MKRLFPYLLVLIVLPFTACSDESDASPIVIEFDNFDPIQVVSGGELIKLKVSTFATGSTIETFSIASFDNEKGDRHLFDTLVQAERFSYSYNYQVPEFLTDSIQHMLSFQSTDAKGYKHEKSAALIVKGGSVLLIERSGLMLYAGNSGRENGFSLSDPSQTFITNLTDSARIDLYAYADTTSTSDVLAREWRTGTDVDFAKMNSFDYVNATRTTVTAAYSSAVRTPYVKGINRGDLVLVGKTGKPWGIIQVIAVYDEEGTTNDGYLINYKAIGH